MVLRCSLLGHDYAEPDVEREREERGSEVVVTVREYEQCDRCGEKHVISENTEVTSLDAGPDEPAAADERDADADVESDAPADLDGTTVDAPAEPDHPAVDDGSVPVDEGGEPVTDDAEILEDDASTSGPEREHGEWPESDDVGPPEEGDAQPAAWPEADAGERDPEPETGSDASGDVEAEGGPVSDDDATFVDADPESGSEHPATGSASKSAANSDRAIAGAGSGSGIESARSAPAPGEGGVPEGVPTEFFCPQCDFVASGDRGSLRTGDICPECRKGYLSERER